MNGITELVFILDRSGSMFGLEADTIGGFNAMLEKQKASASPVLISTTGAALRTSLSSRRRITKSPAVRPCSMPLATP